MVVTRGDSRTLVRLSRLICSCMSVIDNRTAAVRFPSLDCVKHGYINWRIESYGRAYREFQCRSRSWRGHHHREDDYYDSSIRRRYLVVFLLLYDTRYTFDLVAEGNSLKTQLHDACFSRHAFRRQLQIAAESNRPLLFRSNAGTRGDVNDKKELGSLY